MAYALDFKAIKESVPIQQVLEMLDIKHLTPHGEGLRGQCPLCQVTNPRGFVVTRAKNAWYCFSEKKGGDIIELVARHARITQKEAAGRIASHFKLNGATQVPDAASSQHEPAAQRKPDGFDPLAYQQTLQADHDALGELGVSPDTIRQLGGGYASKGVLRGRLALPICIREGTIKAFFGLTLKGETSELLFPKDFVVPYFFNTQNVKEGTLTLVQDVPALLHAMEHGIDNILCTLRPITPDTLTCLYALMTEKKCTELEFY